MGIGAGVDAVDVEAPTEAKTLSNLTALSCPLGHVAELLACAIGRRSSKVVSHVRQRNSYKGIPRV
ncbi:hypothetical protein LBMAG13_09220 [Actinomycetes bacterium]|nr:hypothetical protein LBMAG13_09220 [Actinomycetes bacterium]